MKNLIPAIKGFLVIFCILIALLASAQEKTDQKKAAVRLYCSPDMENLAQQWARDYQTLSAGITIQNETIQPGTTQITEMKENDIALITESELSALYGNANQKIVVGRDVIVPVISSENPLSGLIRNVGLSPQQLSDIVSGRGVKTWGILDPSAKKHRVNLYLSDDENVRKAMAEFLSLPPAEVSGNLCLHTPEIIEKLRADKYGIAWCRLTQITDPETGELPEGIVLLPIDRNGNGKIDHFENIYTEINDFNRGVWIGKYPRQLVSNIYVITPSAGLATAGSEFVKWTITDGQEALASLGHSAMLSIEKTRALEDIVIPENLTQVPGKGMSAAMQVLLILGGLALLIFIIAIISGNSKSKNQSVSGIPEGDGGFINEDSLALPGGMYFDKTHTWAFMEKEGKLRIGIDDFLLHITGAFTRVTMKSPGDKIKKHEHLVTLIREGKQINLYSPVSGTIVAINSSVVNSPSLLNTSPYNEGWLYLMEPANWLREIGFLHMAEKHVVWIKSEFDRLKDFLAIRLRNSEIAGQGFALQEGGRLRDHVLEDLDPEIWEDFQKCFIDTPL